MALSVETALVGVGLFVPEGFLTVKLLRIGKEKGTTIRVVVPLPADFCPDFGLNVVGVEVLETAEIRNEVVGIFLASSDEMDGEAIILEDAAIRKDAIGVNLYSHKRDTGGDFENLGLMGMESKPHTLKKIPDFGESLAHKSM